ncbi:hypothetical protein OG259_25305 [Streptomyces sp. NBC_00250]|nr:hypothetical protein [Streptomyces sp. NBC_00250]
MGALPTTVREPEEVARFLARPGDFEPGNEPDAPRLPSGSPR